MRPKVCVGFFGIGLLCCLTRIRLQAITAWPCFYSHSTQSIAEPAPTHDTLQLLTAYAIDTVTCREVTHRDVLRLLQSNPLSRRETHSP